MKCEGNNPLTITAYTRTWIPRTIRLLSSPDELEREAREGTPGFGRIIRLFDYNNACIGEISDEHLRRSIERARRVESDANELTKEFLKNRDGPDLVDGDLWYWSEYKENCRYRHRWGELLRSNLDWDWDPSESFRWLFKIEEPVISFAGDRGTFHPSIAMELKSPLKEIRVPYKTSTGEVKYKTYTACPSTEDVCAGLQD